MVKAERISEEEWQQNVKAAVEELESSDTGQFISTVPLD